MHLQARDLSYQIPGRTILSNVDLDVSHGTMLGLVGINGSGKTTLIRALAGLRDPAHGTIAINGTDF